MEKTTPPLSPLAQKIQQRLTELGINRAEAARRAGLNPAFLTDIFRGKAVSPKLENIQKLAAALQISVDDLGTTTTTAPPAPIIEPTLEIWQPNAPDDDAVTQPNIDQVLLDLAPGARHPSGLRLRNSILSLGLLSGDVVIIDLNTQAQPGDLVVVNALDAAGKCATTLIRRYHPPYLLPGDPLDRTSLLADGHHCVIMGPVVASFRQHTTAA